MSVADELEVVPAHKESLGKVSSLEDVFVRGAY
jgi:hypothetical protein